MGISNRLPQDLEEVDVIIAGGGTAACVIAGRLAEELGPDVSILVIERGRDNFDVPHIIHPVFAPANLLPEMKTAIFYKGRKSEELGGREPIVPSGGTLGGGSSINFLLYTRAQRSDFDAWKAPGWSTDELLPFLKKLETYHGPGSPAVHGYEGPVQISSGTFRSERVEAEFLDTAASVLDVPQMVDLQDLDSNDGVGKWLRTVSPVTGRRQDAAHTYLHPKLRDMDTGLPTNDYPNLHVLTEHLAVRVLLEDCVDAHGAASKRAVGVELTPTPEFLAAAAGSSGPPATQQQPRVVRARRQVVVSCGALGTPATLERSGIGAPAVLERAGVPLQVPLPGVGADYQDHHVMIYGYESALEERETVDSLLSGRLAAADAVQSGRLGWNGFDAGSKIRMKAADVASLGPDFETPWNRDFGHDPNRPDMLYVALAGSVDHMLHSSSLTGPLTFLLELTSPTMNATYLPRHVNAAMLPKGQYLALGTYSAYPYSRGFVHISGPSVADPLDFETGYFKDEHDIDVKKMIWAYKKQREIARRMPCFRGEIPSGHPPFPPGSKAACVGLAAAPVAAEVRDVEYGAEDDRAIERFIREQVATTWHSLGTAKMAPLEQGGVVGPDLSVHGVQGLKVADLSIPPENIGGNTCNTAFVIGEKASDIILKEMRAVAVKSGAV
ncbi:hypothetical protein RB594_006530 [Gaeumannomyces avenae]